MDAFQFYPTPPTLAAKAWGKFKDRDYIRVLEPSAGEGHLAAACPRNADHRYHSHSVAIDCLEIDLSKHATLRSKGFEVTGFDFMQMKSAAMYSHIILNPPFAEGAKHLLHAWDILWEGEIVAIINAETLRNPFSMERQRLVQLIGEHGEVEYIGSAFSVPEAERKAEVDVAMIWLKKSADANADIFGTLLSDLQNDAETGAGLVGDYRVEQALALPSSEIENQVLIFNAAVKSRRDAILADVRANHYSALLGKTMAETVSGSETSSRDRSVDAVRKELGSHYRHLKDQAWTSILRSTNVTDRLSAKAQKRLESEFEQIKQLDFSVANIYGFLCGLIGKQGEIQMEMVLDTFDEITRYHSDNACYFMGWKSNDRHRRCGMRIRNKRFILPCFKHDGWRNSLDWDQERFLADFDKVFAMLDGKLEPEFGLVQAFKTHFHELRVGKRITSDYFDIRWYPGNRGTIHFFPRSQAMMDKLNRLVGQQRAWIPPETTPVSDDFWTQYAKAEKFDKEFREAVSKTHTRHWDDPFWKLERGTENEQAEAADRINGAMRAVLEKHGINVDFQLEHKQNEQQLLLLAA
jgi:hypothetical protein